MLGNLMMLITHILTLHDMVHNFHRTFLSGNNSCPFETWYGASYKGPTCHLSKPGSVFTNLSQKHSLSLSS